jgi:hypothetical protein
MTKKTTIILIVSSLLIIGTAAYLLLRPKEDQPLSLQLATLIEQSNQDRALLRVYISKQDSTIDAKTLIINDLQQQKDDISRTVYTLSRAVGDMNSRYKDLPTPRYDVGTQTIDSSLYYKGIATRAAKDLAQADITVKQLVTMTELYQLSSAKNVKYEAQIKTDSITIAKSKEVNVAYVKTTAELKAEKRKATWHKIGRWTEHALTVVAVAKIIDHLRP